VDISVFFKCWWCAKPESGSDLVRLGDIVSLGGHAPGDAGKRGAERICRSCATTFATLRYNRESELAALPGLSESTT
jgi:hypothetical protein